MHPKHRANKKASSPTKKRTCLEARRFLEKVKDACSRRGSSAYLESTQELIWYQILGVGEALAAKNKATKNYRFGGEKIDWRVGFKKPWEKSG